MLETSSPASVPSTPLAALGALLVAGLVLLMVMRTLVDSMLFYPERGQWRTPEALGLAYEEVWLEADGDRVQSWWIHGPGGGPIIVMFHGNAGTIADRLDNARLMVDQLAATVYLVEYPGYGDSAGRPSEKSLFATGERALTAARERGVGRHLVLFGRSLGGAVAVHLSSARAAGAARPDALIIEATFTSLAELGRALGFPVAGPLLPYRFSSIEAMGDVEVPLLVLHGDRDEIVPFAMGQELFEAATGAVDRRFHRIAGAGHNDTVLVGGRAYWEVWRRFLSDLDQEG